MQNGSQIRFQLRVKNFLAIRQANLTARSPVIVLVGANKSGKTQLMYLLYSLFWAKWRARLEEKANGNRKGRESLEFEKALKQKLKGVFLIRKFDDLVNWQAKGKKCTVELIAGNKERAAHLRIEEKKVEIEESLSFTLDHSPTFIAPLIGEYYKGIWALHKVSPSWRLVSEAVSDFINDLFLYADRKKSSPLLQRFEKWAQVSFYTQENRIYAKEQGRSYKIERAASGLKSMSAFYLAVQHGLIGEYLFLDEPESGLHPEYIQRWSAWISRFSEANPNTTVIIATHSEYVLEALNVALKNGVLSEIDLWHLKNWEEFRSGAGADWESVTATPDTPLDSSSLTEVYLDLLRQLHSV